MRRVRKEVRKGAERFRRLFGRRAATPSSAESAVPEEAVAAVDREEAVAVDAAAPPPPAPVDVAEDEIYRRPPDWLVDDLAIAPCKHLIFFYITRKVCRLSRGFQNIRCK